jgi:hypothetical protein
MRALRGGGEVSPTRTRLALAPGDETKESERKDERGKEETNGGHEMTDSNRLN